MAMEFTGLLQAADAAVFEGQRRAVFLGQAMASFISEEDKPLFGDRTFDGIPTMVTRRELAFLLNFFSSIPVSGDVLEIGSYLGGSTGAIGRGLARAGFSGSYYVLDSFKWADEGFVNCLKQDCSKLNLSDGARAETNHGAWLKAFEEIHATKPYATFLSPHRALIPYGNEDATFPISAHVPAGKQIGAVFIDGFKSWSATYAGMTALAPYLSTGSLLIFQDFSWIDCDWLPVLARYLHGKMSLWMKIDNTAIFRLDDANISPCLKLFASQPDPNKYDFYAEELKSWASAMYHSGDVTPLSG
ncbi:MAG TPA: class I SAM-dependent methyltransferase [Hyphomicrobium sp.]|nr:class I SAM-dependent methyltransferase [Hyphomicrobium sp.]